MADAAIKPSASPLSQLNPEQRAAVEATDGPVLVLAGAGTGKTRVLTSRIAHILMTKRAFPGEILAVTFTNKAAREMSERVTLLTGNSQGLWLGTFHSIGVRVLRRHAEALGLGANFVILDEDDQMRLLKSILAERNIDAKTLPPKLFSAIIQSWKDQGLTPEKVTSARDLQVAGGEALAVYKEYQSRLRSLNAVDFGDLILHMLTLFNAHPSILKEYAQRFKYILVDEYQDTNVAQYLWLRLLALGHQNICCVGDDDQSIYSWRGAEVGNILRFERDFPDAKIVRLERNYRSTPHILAAASGLIANNQSRLGKTLWTEEKEGERIRLKSTWDEGEEARYVGEEIEAMQLKGVSLSNMAILVRAGFQTRAFEERFLSMGIPYRVIGGLRFYERAEIRDTVAYLRLIGSGSDDLAFERIVNVPRRGIGQATLQQMHTTARSMNTSLLGATEHLLKSTEFKGKLGASIGKFVENIDRWRAQLDGMTLSELTDLVLEESGYRAMWQQEKSPDAAGRLENLKELVRAMGEFENLGAFLDHVSLVMEAASAGPSADMVNVMTLHAAKGLEFNTVFLPGWEEGLFPHPRALEESGTKGLEEERRLAYVGITRARERLYVIHAANRRVFNQWQSNIPSRFISEIPKENIEQLEGGAYGRPRVVDYRAEAMAIMDAAPAAGPRLNVGQRVFHQKFGYGVIRDMHGDHLDVAFDKAGDKKILADFIKIA